MDNYGYRNEKCLAFQGFLRVGSKVGDLAQ